MLKRTLILVLVLLFAVTSLNVCAAEPTVKTYIEAPESISANTEFEVNIFAEGDSISALMGSFIFEESKMTYLGISAEAGESWVIPNPQVENGSIQFVCADEKDQNKAVINEKTAIMTISFMALVDSEDISFSLTNQEAFCITNILNGTGENVRFDDTVYSSLSPEDGENGAQSDNNYLKSLTVKDVNMTPKFSWDVEEYNLVVYKEVTELEIIAIAEDDEATIEITGQRLELEGKDNKNVTTITVTSQSGLARTYVINTYRIENPNSDEANTISWLWVAIIGGVIIIVALAVVRAKGKFIKNKKH